MLLQEWIDQGCPINTLVLGDGLIGIKHLPDKCINLCVTDPPYGVGLKYNTYDDTLENWYKLMDSFIPEIRRVCQMTIFPSCSINKLEWVYRNHPPDWLMCWYKGSPGHSAYVGFNDFEPLLVYDKIKGLSMHDYIAVNNDEKMGNHGHPCPKPVKWYKAIIHPIDKSVKIKTVIDPFCGSGSLPISCIDFGFDWLAFEIDEEYYNAALKRIEMHSRKPKTFFNEKDLYNHKMKKLI